MMNSRERVSNLQNRLREALDQRKMKAAELSEATGVPKGAISYYLSGKSTPKADRLYTISKALDISEAWLLGFDVPRDRTAAQKKNDNLAKIIVRMRNDSDFFEMVSNFAELSDEEAQSIKQLLSVLKK